MSSTIRMLLIDPDIRSRDALAEQFDASPDFDISGRAVAAQDQLGATHDLHHIDVVVLCGAGATENAVSGLTAGGFAGPVIALSSRPMPDVASVHFAPPVRFSTLASAIRASLHDHARSDHARFAIGPYEYQPSERLLVAPDRESVRLTDKEAGILRYLHRAGDRPVGRDELLGEVWGYNSGVTTHTLETHIYRLRQKMEPGEGNSRLLITEEGGYRLAGVADNQFDN